MKLLQCMGPGSADLFPGRRSGRLGGQVARGPSVTDHQDRLNSKVYHHSMVWAYSQSRVYHYRVLLQVSQPLLKDEVGFHPLRLKWQF